MMKYFNKKSIKKGTINLLLISLILIFEITLNFSVTAQKRTNNWIFKGFSLNFNENPVKVTQNSLTNSNSLGYTSICDTFGNLLLYTNSFTVWDKNGELMLNGDSLLVPGEQGSSVQQSLIVPKPGTLDIYYIFTVAPWNGNSSSGLYYAEVDMSLNSGLGKVTKKGIRLSSSTTNKITAVYHKNRHDIWIINHLYGTNQYNSYLVGDLGVNSNAVISNVGKPNNSSFNGQLKAAPDGSKIAVSYELNGISGEGFDLFDFNSEDGKLLNSKSFTMPYRACEGLEFSSDATKLYVHQYGSTGESSLYQYDISQNDLVKINNSRIRILSPLFSDYKYFQLASDGRIYFSKGGGDYSGMVYLGVINSPNELGKNCNPVEKGLYLNGGDCMISTMPNFIQNYLFKTNFIFSGTCFKDTTTFSVSNVTRIDSVRWLLGDSYTSKELNPKHQYMNPGLYKVKLLVHYPERTDTIKKDITIHELPKIYLGQDTTVCYGYKMNLANQYDSIFWNNKSKLKYMLPDITGKYWVKVKNEYNCLNSDTINLIVNPSPIVNLGNDTAFCDNSTFRIRSKGTFPHCTFLWNNFTTDSVLSVNQPGVYTLKATNIYSCSSIDSIKITSLKSPAVNIGKDTTIYSINFLYLDAGYYGYPTSYLWDNFSTSEYRYINGSALGLGSHKIFVRVTAPNKCKASDTISINVLSNPKTNITDLFLGEEIKVYPNPVADLLTIELKDEHNYVIEICSLEGKVLFQKLINKNNSIIDLHGYKSNIYLIRIFDGPKCISMLKIIKE